jgi:hypothetical protein
METIYDGDGDVVVCEDRHYPILVNTYYGAATQRSVRQYFRWLHTQAERGLKDGLALAFVSDGGLAGVPDADTRRLIAELATDLNAKIPPQLRWYTVIVVESRVVRGVLNTLNWLQGDLQMDYVSSRADAFARAREHLLKRGIALPSTVDSLTTTRPQRPAARANVARR